MSRPIRRALAIQAAHSAPAIPALPRHEEVDLALRQSAKRLELGFLDFIELCDEAIQGKYYERFGYADAAPYFAERIGCSYRTVCRRLAVLEALRALPAGQMPAAKEALAELGSHKASILAPAFEKEPADWQEWVELARGATEEALQDAVSSALGHRARGRSREPGEAFLHKLLMTMPPELASWTEAVFRAGMRAADTSSPMAVFILMVERFAADLADQGIEVPSRQ